MQRACVVVDRIGTDEQAEALVEKTAYDMGARYARIQWYWTDEVPDWMAVGAADQLAAHRRDAGPNAIYLVIEVYELGREAMEAEGFTDEG